MTTTNTEQQDIERQEEQPASYATLPERMAALEATQRLLIEIVRENGRRSDENYQTLDAKIDSSYQALNSKIDSLMRLLIIVAFSLGGAILAALIMLVIAVFIR